MPIWGRRDSEPAADEAHGGEAGARDTQEPAAGHQSEARASQSGARDTQGPAAEHQAGEPAPAFWRAQGRTAGPFAPAENEDQAAAHDAEAQEPAAEAGEPVMVEAKELAGAQAQEPAGAQAQEATGAEAQEATGAEAQEAAQTDAKDSVISAQRWREILVAFVDDPRGSVMMASDAVDEAIDEFVSSVWARQRALASSWQGSETGTEQLRTTLLDYRTLWHQVRQLDLGRKPGG